MIGNAASGMGALRDAGLRLARAQGRLTALAQTALAQALVMVLNLATGVLTARLLGPEGRGVFAAVSLWAMIPSLLASAGLQSAVVFEGRQDGEKRAAITTGALALATAAYALMAVACWPLIGWLLRGYAPSVIALARWVLVVSVLNVWVVITRQSLLTTRDFAAFNVSTVCYAGIYLVFLTAFGLAGSLTPGRAVWCQCAGTALVFAASLPHLTAAWRRGIAPVLLPCRRVLGRLVRFSLRAAPADALSAVAGQMDRLVLVSLIAPAELGLYAAALAFARVLSVLQTALASVMLADLSGRPREEIALFVHRGFRVLFWLLACCCGTLLLGDRELLRLAYGPAFSGAAPVFRILLAEASLACLSVLLSQAFLAAGKPATTSTAQAAAFACSTGGMLVLAPGHGALGASIALATAGLVRLLLLLAGLHRIGIAMPSLLLRSSDLEPIVARLRKVWKAS